MFPVKKAPVPFEVQVYDIIHNKSADYMVMRFIGEGGFGKVAKCVDLKTADAAAIKIHIDCRSYEIEKEIAMLEEIKALDADRHNLVKFIDNFTFKGLSCLAFEMLDKSLWDFMKKRKTGLHLNEIRPIAQQLLVAFQALKSIGIIHADLKPDNVMLVDHKYEPFRVKLIDFGCSLKVANVRTGTLAQNVNYRAPEVTLGLPVSEAIDMWGLGCVLAFLFFNNDLFPARCKFHMLQRVCDLLGKPENHLLDAGRNTWQFFHRDILETGWILKNPEQYNEATGIKPWITEWGFTKIDDLKEAVVTQNNSGLLEDRKRFARLLKMLLRVDAGRRVTPDAALGFNFITMAHLQKNINNSADDALELMKFASKDYLKGCGDSSRMAAERQSPDLAAETKSPDCGVVRKGLYRFVYVAPEDHLPLTSPVSYWGSRRDYSDKNRSSEIEMVTPISCNISFLEENDIEPSGTKASAGLDIDGTYSATSKEEVPAQTSFRRESPTHGARCKASSAHEISNACLPPANARVARGVVVSTPANRGSVLRNSRPKARTLPKLPTESHPSVSPKKNKKAKKNSLKNGGGLSSSDGHSHSSTANACGVVVSTPAHRGSVLRSSRPKARTLPEPPTQAGVSPNRPTKEKKAENNNLKKKKKDTTTANVNNGDRAPASAPNNSKPVDLDSYNPGTEVPAQTSCKRALPSLSGGHSACSTANAGGASGVVVRTPAHRGSVVLRGSRPQARPLPKPPTQYTSPSVSPKRPKNDLKNKETTTANVTQEDRAPASAPITSKPVDLEDCYNNPGTEVPAQTSCRRIRESPSLSGGNSACSTANAGGAGGVVVRTPAHRGSVVLRGSRPQARPLPKPPTQYTSPSASPNRPTKEKKAKNNNLEKKKTTTANVTQEDRAPATAPINSKPVDLDNCYNNPGTEVPAQISCRRIRESPSLSGGKSACSNANAGGAGGVVVRTPAHRGSVVLRGSRPQARPLPEPPTRSHPSVSPNRPIQEKKANNNNLKKKKKTMANETNEDRAPTSAPITSKPVDLDSYNPGTEVPAQTSCKRGLPSLSGGNSACSTANAGGAGGVVVRTPAHRGSVVLRGSRPQARPLPEPPTHTHPSVSPNRPIKEKKANNNNLKKKKKTTANVTQEDRAPASAPNTSKPVDLEDCHNKPGREVPAQTSCKREVCVVVKTPAHRDSVVLRSSRPQVRTLPEPPQHSTSPSVSPIKRKKKKNKQTANVTNEDRAPASATKCAEPVDVLDNKDPGTDRQTKAIDWIAPQVRILPEPPHQSISVSPNRPIRRKKAQNKKETTVNETYEDRAQATALKNGKPVLRSSSPQVRILPEPRHRAIDVSPNRPKKTKKAQKKKTKKATANVPDQDIAPAIGKIGDHVILLRCNHYKEPVKARRAKPLDRIIKFARRISNAVASIFRR